MRKFLRAQDVKLKPVKSISHVPCQVPAPTQERVKPTKLISLSKVTLIHMAPDQDHPYSHG